MSGHQYTYPPTAPASISRGISTSANPDEDWTKISDPGRRRRLQNRINKRNSLSGVNMNTPGSCDLKPCNLSPSHSFSHLEDDYNAGYECPTTTLSMPSGTDCLLGSLTVAESVSGEARLAENPHP
ncbi:hypothetical protein GQ607_014372 [Colletotrichum asianum]|uniref:BZIP domain-containing protein n=1 Tax=Colletotrichum asianum TaxID=702518 RepID=A0A8H3W0R9_9PEZI|nr:hypothetical protein GQ607_014372 [Colletotrichum asianum]